MPEINAVTSASLGEVIQDAPVETLHVSKLDKVTEILRGDENPPQAPETELPAEPVPETEWDLKALAEKLGADPEKLYSTKVPLADGKTVTLGELKDKYRDTEALETERKSHREERGKFEAERLQLNREVSALLAGIPPQFLIPQAFEQATRQVKEQQAREAEATLKALPEWSDAMAKAADFKVLDPLAREYGYSEHEIQLAQQGLVDHRFVKAMRDFSRLKAELAGIKANAPKPKVLQNPQAAQSATPAQEFGRIKAAVTAKHMKPVEAVGKILRG